MPSKIINIYFGATGEDWDYIEEGDKWSARGWFMEYDSARLVQAHEMLDATDKAVKIGVAGASGTGGLLWGAGVKKAVDFQAERIRTFLTLNPSFTIVLNAFGTSRGGVSALLLAKALSDIELTRLEINLVVLDPVPGNLLSTQQLGISFSGRATLTQQAMDLSECQHIRHVLCLYALKKGQPIDEDLKTISGVGNNFYSQLMPQWPPQAQVEEDVYPGDHALFLQPLSTNNRIVMTIYQRCFDFLSTHGYSQSLEKRYVFWCAGMTPTEKSVFLQSQELYILSREDMLSVYQRMLPYDEEAFFLDNSSSESSDENPRKYGDAHEKQSSSKVSEKQSSSKVSENQCHASRFEKTTIVSSPEMYINLHHASLELDKNIHDLSNENCSLRVQRTVLRSTLSKKLYCEKETLLAFCQFMMGIILPEDHASGRFIVLDNIQHLLRTRDNLPLPKMLVFLITLLVQKDDILPRGALDITIEALGDYPSYTALKQFILDTLGLSPEKKISRTLLVKFVLEKGDEYFFNEKNKNRVYDLINKKIQSPSFLQENFLAQNASLNFMVSGGFGCDGVTLVIFCQHIITVFSEVNHRHRRKNRLLNDVLNFLDETNNDRSLPSIFILLIALVLQHDHHHVAAPDELNKAIELLNDCPDFDALKAFIRIHLNLLPDKKIDAHILKSFVLTEDDADYFQSKNAERTYKAISDKISELSPAEEILSEEDTWGFIDTLPSDKPKDNELLVRPYDVNFFHTAHKFSQQISPNQRSYNV